ncbi:non-ribosomal peptide synthetase, partial [Francisella sp. 19X1-34]|uniref:non-ribosomal peptide synthetase n=1 Tax=Francisella sp. 19X1-34 TaxID=3087177 RepID=UPI002E3711B8
TIAKLDDRHIDLSILTDQERDQIVYNWNQTDKDYPKDKTIYQLFEEQVKQNPDNVALVFEDKELTYKELNQRSNQLARYIRRQYKEITNQELKPDTLIPLCLERSMEMVIGILAVMKAGGAYVPMDPDYPEERFRHILADTQAKLVITQSHLEDKLNYIANDISLMSIDPDKEQSYIYAQEDKQNLKPQSSSTDLAYVIYTSGTTGLPKGGMIEYKSLINLSQEQIKGFDIKKDSKVLQFASYIFDASVSEIFTSLIIGAELYICSEKYRKNSEQLINYIIKSSITIATLPPVLLSSFEYQYIPSLSTLITAGESCELEVMNEWSKDRIFINAYGPTESTVCASMHEYKEGDISTNIGRSLDNIKLYILDQHQQPVPIGVVGELYIGGAGLARGYLNRDELTAERFISNPFANKSDISKGYTRLYKTGDLVRWLADGNIEYIGRNDDQVKVRGYRIELGEIENQLSAIYGIKQSCVLAKDRNNSKYLVGYYVSDVESLTQEEILNQLSKVLPEYMVPSVLVEIDSMPLTVNGKLDRKALPEPEFINEDSYVSPSTELEEKLCSIFGEVLGLDRVGITDDFFRIGGNSILAIKLSHCLTKQLDQQISVADIFKYKSINQLSSYLESNSIDKIVIPKVKLDIYPLSFAQERLWFIERYEGGSNAYHIPMLVSLEEGIDVEALKQSIQSIVGRHEVLRSVFRQDNEGNDYQVVLNDSVVISEYGYKDTDISKQIDSDINTPFDLTKDYPTRVSLYEEESDIKLLINMHHIASDGWSIDIFIKELNAYYNHYTNNIQLALPELSIQYKDFAVWQREYLEGDVLEKQLDYWRGRLEGYETLNLPTDFVRPSKIDYTGCSVEFEIDEGLSDKLRDIAKNQNCSLYTIMLSAFYILIHKYTSQENIVIGSTIANRHHSQIQDLIGFFVNSLALREQVDGSESILELVKRVHANLIEAQSHQDLPFERLVSELNVEQDLSRHPIFQVVFGLQSFGRQENQLFKPVVNEINYKIAKFDISCFIDDSQSNLLGSISYATSLYSRDTVEKLVKSYKKILSHLVNNKATKIKNYSLLTKEEYQTIVYDWNQTDKEYSKDKTIYQLFEEQAEQNPDNVALVFEDKQLTYRELNQRSNQLARYIRSQYKEITNQELKPDTLIPLCLERSMDMIIGILAVMKAGGAYVPMDPEYPEERFRHIFEDTQARLVITQSHLENKLHYIANDISLISIDLSKEGYIYDQEGKENLTPQSSSTDLAYVIYTSGTTGLPKGVMVEHKGFVNYNQNQIKYFNYPYNKKIYLIQSYAFDTSLASISISILSGNTLYLVDEQNKLDATNYIGMDIAYIPPAYLESVDINTIKELSHIVVSGDKLYGDILKETSCNVINEYGPTESTVCASMHEYKEGDINTNIGKPLNNTKLYILDQHYQPVPIGVVGELYIGGAGLARGYLNRPELTAGRFVPNPFATESDIAKGYTRLYKTGDLVRWLADGNIEYIGRNDDQVKIRGYRIELEEIENQLSAIAGIKQSCVLAKDRNNNKYLVGYYVSDEESLTQEEILNQLSKVLPEYIVPSVFVKIDSMPLTVNGKLDRKSLPDPEFINEGSYIAPTTELEERLCNIFAEVLGLEKVGITDDFFRIGGNSILAIKLSYRLSKEFNKQISVADVFITRNIKILISEVEKLNIIKPFYKSYNNNLPNILLIHPGSGGCEVYNTLASSLINKYNTIGIDNYNISSKNKISSLNELSKYYLNQYLEKYSFNKKPIHLLGWSLGGQIALEIANILESEGFNNVRVTLLDTILTDDQLNQYQSSIDIDDYKSQMREYMIKEKEYGSNYVNKVEGAFEAERELLGEYISNKLEKSKVTLLKAAIPDIRFNNDVGSKLNNYILSLKDNNISKVVCNLTIKEVNAHHGNILEKIDEILEVL